MKALIAMSGGVDSSVAGLLAQEQGWDCVGCTMQLRADENVTGETCGSSQDVADARAVAERLGIPFHVFDFTADFKAKVIDKFIRCYECGMTPNPCVDCNRYLKFDRLYDSARVLGCDVIVTGHYAQVVQDGTQYYLKKARDSSKDQSYFLYHLSQTQLAHTQFPLGALTKTEVRALAEAHGFRNAQKKESQDICFVPNGDYAQVIQDYTGKQYPQGNFVTADGKVLGQHRGIIHYTVGQRKGLNISADRRLYVCAICPAQNTVCLGDRADLFQSTAVAQEFHWINGVPPATTLRCTAKIRYNQTEQPATVEVLSADRVRVTFDEPQRAITPGQALVLYQDDIVLGGGILVQA